MLSDLGAFHTMKRPLPKSSHFWARGEGRSSLKYMKSVFLLDFEYFIFLKIWSHNKSLDFHSWCVQTLAESPNSWRQKYCHVGTLEAFYLWTLGISVKAERLDSHSPPIKLLDFFHLSTNGHSVKPLLIVCKPLKFLQVRM